MKRQTFFRAMLALSIIFASFTAKAQLDTAWFQCDYGNQYIFPPLADSNYRYDGLESFATGGYVNSLIVSDDEYGSGNIKRVAQRYEVSDSVKIMGVSALVFSSTSMYLGYCDTVTVGIWNERLSSELYSQTFVSGGITPYANNFRFIEYLFDDTITLYGDYHISLYSGEPCPFPNLTGQAGFTAIPLKSCLPSDCGGTYPSGICPPSGCGTKYPLYVSYCSGDRVSDWVRAIDINNWERQLNSYDYMFGYPNAISENCDTMVYAPVGICPIRALEDTVSQDTVSQDTTSSSVLSVELLERAVRLYPNPANEVLNVACDYDIESIAVFDAVNRLGEERKVNSKTLQLPLANYAQGTYFITIITPKGKLNKKFVVQ